MTSPDECREALRQAAARRIDARRSVEEATIGLADAAIQARAAGVPITEIARIAGLSRRAIYNLIAWRRGEKPDRS